MKNDNTERMVKDVYPEKIFQDFYEQAKETVTGSTRIDNWKLVAGLGSGIIYPTIPFLLGSLYGIYKLLESDSFKLEEGRHYEATLVKEVEEGEEK